MTRRIGITAQDRSRRAISTVVDVTMALLLISASTMLIGYHLSQATDRDDHDPHSATQIATTLSESTISIAYDVGGVKDEDTFDEPTITDDATYARTDHGTPLGMLADAAVTNYRIDGAQVLAYSSEYQDAVDYGIRDALMDADHEYYVVARWEPYDGAAINGTATAGERPPPTADVSSTTTTVSSGFPAVDEDRLETAWLTANETWDERIDRSVESNASIATSLADAGDERSENATSAAAGKVIGDAVVEGLFPPIPAQYALESQGIDRALEVYHYRAFADAVGDVSFRSPKTHPPLVRREANALDANRRLVEGQRDGYAFTDDDGLDAWIATDLRRAFADEFADIDATADGAERDQRKLTTVRNALSTENVTITIQTWNE